MDEKEYIPGESEVIDRWISQADKSVLCVGCNHRFPASIQDFLTKEEVQARIDAGLSPLITVACHNCKDKLKDYTFKQSNR